MKKVEITRLILMILLSILIAEALVMLGIRFVFPPLSIAVELILDSVILVLILAPVLYNLLFLPLLTSKKKILDTEVIYSNLIKMTGDGFLIVDVESGKILEANDAYCNMIGYARSELLQMRISDVAANKAPEDIGEHIKRVLKKGHDRFTTYHKPKSGELISFEVSVTFLHNLNKLYAFFHDNTRQRKAEDSLVESEELLNEAQQLAQLGSWSMDLISGEVKWSKTLYEINKRNPQLPPPTYEELAASYTKESWEQLQFVVKRAIADGTPYELELDIIRGDGKIIQTYTYGKALKDKTGRIVQLHGTVQDITERKLEEQKLRDSEYFFKESQQSAFIGSYKADFVANKWESSEVLDQIFGIDKNYNRSVAGWLDITHPDDRERMSKYLQEEVILKRLSFNMEYRIIRKSSGEMRWVNGLGKVGFDGDGNVVSLMGTIQDITERKLAEEAVRESEKMFRILYNDTPVMMHSINQEGELLSVSDFWLEKLGYEREEVLGKNFTEFLLESSRAYALKFILPQFLMNGKIDNADYCFVKKNGEVLDCIVSAISQYDKNKNFTRSLAVITDITERTRAQQKLLDSEIKFRSVLQTTQDAIILADENKNIIYWNDAAETMFGYTEMETLGKPLSMIMPEKYEKTFMQRSVRHDSSAHTKVLGKVLEFNGLRKDGSEFPVEHSISSWQSENGKFYCGILRDITVRKQAEEEIVKSEEKYRDIVENISDLICTHDISGRILSVNPSAVKFLGYEESKLLSMNIQDILADDVINQYASYIDRIKKDGHSTGLMKVRTANGKRRIWEFSNSLRTEGVAEPIVRGLAKDVTSRIKAEAALRKSENNLHAIFENTSTGFVLLDTSLNILSYNPRAEFLLKLAFGDQVNMKNNFLEILPPERLLVFSETLKKLLIGEAVQFDIPYQHADGSKNWFDISCKPVFDVKKSVVGISFAVNEITERKNIIQKLSESEARNRLLLETMMEGVLYVNNADVIQFVNTRFCEMLGHTPEELIGKVANQVLFQEGNREKIAKIAQERMQGIPSTYEMELKKKSGEKILFLIKGSPVFDEQGNVMGSMGTHTDITEQKKTELEKEKLISELSNKFNELMQFNYIVSHNLRSPIANILGLSNLITMPNVSAADKQKMFGHIQSAANSMDTLIKDLSVILSIRSSINVNKEKVSIRALLKGIRHTLETQIMQSNAAIKLNIREDAAELFTVKSYLESIFYNLISNAIKFHSADRFPAIIISCKREISEMLITVSDNGRGIDMKLHGKSVFGLYKRFHLDVEGQGLGLLITKTQVEALGGKITMESEVNKGTKFTIRLPFE